MSKLLLLSSATVFFLGFQSDNALAASDVICQAAGNQLVIKFNRFDEDVEFNGTKFEFCDRHNPPNKPISWSRFNCGNNREMKHIEFGVTLQDGQPLEVEFKFSHYHSPDDVDVLEGTMPCN